MPMDKDILHDYVDACELIRETEDDIKRLRKKRKTVIQTNVKGSNPDFPYNSQHFKIQGTPFTYSDDCQLRIEEKLLEERKANAERVKLQVEKWMCTIPSRMQRIIRYKIFENQTWEQVAEKIGRKATGDSVKMEFRRFLEKK